MYLSDLSGDMQPNEAACFLAKLPADLGSISLMHFGTFEGEGFGDSGTRSYLLVFLDTFDSTFDMSIFSFRVHLYFQHFESTVLMRQMPELILHQSPHIQLFVIFRSHYDYGFPFSVHL